MQIIVRACTMITVHACTMTMVHACTMIIVHACIMIIVYACTLIIAHVCTMIIVHACSMIMVHACTLIIVHACAMIIVHACIMIIDGQILLDLIWEGVGWGGSGDLTDVQSFAIKNAFQKKNGKHKRTTENNEKTVKDMEARRKTVDNHGQIWQTKRSQRKPKNTLEHL